MPVTRNLPSTRRQLLRQAAVFALAEVIAMHSPDAAEADADLCQGDVAVDATTALLFSTQAPLVPADGQQDARAVWTHVPERPDPAALLFLHGHNNYVTVDAAGRSRVPDWAAPDPAARAGASAKKAAPLIYGLDRLETRNIGRKPLVLAPENGVLSTGSFWAREPSGQYADPERLGRLVDDCLAHLTCLHRPDGHPYLSSRFRATPLRRLCLCGHSGAGLPLEEAAVSSRILPESGAPADLWLFDCTYWSQIRGFVQFCARWHTAGRLAAGKADGARFVCVYRPQTQTEEVADALRNEIAQILGTPAASLVRDHTPANFESEIRPALGSAAALFVRTHLPHDDIPTFFIPELLRTSPPAR